LRAIAKEDGMVVQSDGTVRTVTLDVSGLHWATSTPIVERTLRARPGVVSVIANAVGQSATVAYDPNRTTVAQLRGWVRDCGFHCSGQVVPGHVCDPMAEGSDTATSHVDQSHDGTGHEDVGHGGMAAGDMGHEGMAGHAGHAGMSMADMVADMRRRFLVAAVLSVPILLWSTIGREVLHFTAAAPFALRDDVFSLVLSLPVVFYSGWIFFAGAWRALRARTLDMMVLVAVAIAAGWLYSLGITLTGGGDVFYEAASVLTAFVLLGH
jgi:Cu2+-exporting ATPase